MGLPMPTNTAGLVTEIEKRLDELALLLARSPPGTTETNIIASQVAGLAGFVHIATTRKLALASLTIAVVSLLIGVVLRFA